jgi:UDP-GlcNAc:undecaprenyl-phosphate GlcNAc-1-phosphate transferase
MKNIYLYFLSCGATIFFVTVLDNPARRFGLIDIPSGRKNHSGEVPLTGGLAMFLAIVLTVFSHGTLGGAYASIFPALLLLVVTGACDDRFDLSAGSRFVTQAIAALLMIYLGKVAITDLGDLFGGGAVRLAAWSTPFTVFCVIGVINAVNMLDGVDGLAGGVVLVVFMAFGGAALLSGNATQATLLFVLAGAVAGFIVFNMRSPWRSRAAVFMGDSGSMMLGFAVAWFAIELTNQAPRAFSPITAVWILAIPILDTVSLMLRRILKKQSPFAPDHDHLHHIFLRAGFSVQQTVALIVSLSSALGLAGIAAWYCGVPEYVMFYFFLLLFLLYFFGMLYAWKLMKILRGIHNVKLG